MNKYFMAASDISLDPPQRNEIYFSVTMRMLTTETNLNGVRLTEGFINDIAEHAEEYTCMPLCADAERLARGQDFGLTHMYDEQEGMFRAPQIGSFYEVHKVTDEHGVSLVGTARINKRNADVTEKIVEMFRQNRLKFSFEIWASDITEEDGVIVVDAAEGNRLTAMAIVTTPALPAAIALAIAADVDPAVYGTMIMESLDETYGVRAWNIIQTLDDSIVVGLPDSNTYRHITYRMDDGRLIMTENYEVVFVRPEEVNREVDNENEIRTADGQEVEEVVATEEGVIDTNKTIPEVAEQAVPEQAEDADKSEEPEADSAEPVKAESEEDKAEESEPVKAAAEDDPRIAELTRELETLRAEVAGYREAEKMAQLAEKREAAKKYAEREHLDLNAESVKTAIENADYEALAAEVMAKPADNESDETYRVVAEMNTSPYGNMFERVK